MALKLQDWMTANDYSVHDVAKAVEVAPHSVANWLAEKNVPNSTTMRRIIELTGGEIQPNDFFEAFLPKEK